MSGRGVIPIAGLLIVFVYSEVSVFHSLKAPSHGAGTGVVLETALPSIAEKETKRVPGSTLGMLCLLIGRFGFVPGGLFVESDHCCAALA